MLERSLPEAAALPGPRTLFLGSYGHGNLGDELCLIEAMQAFPSSEAWTFSTDPAFTAHCVPGLAGFIPGREGIPALRPQRVVLGGGGIGFFPAIRNLLHWAHDALALGAEIHIHNIGVARMEDRAWAEAPEVQRVMAALATCSVRDELSWFCLREWAPGVHPGITRLPERLLPADPALVSLLPKGRPLLGLSMTNMPLMRKGLAADAARVERALARFRGHVLVPVVSTVHQEASAEDDIAGFEAFRQRFLPEAELACACFLDRGWWRANFTPLRLKGVIARLDVLFSHRKHNLVHAIGAGTRFVAISPSGDDSLSRLLYTLRELLPDNSSSLCLRAQP
jgi:hypothetical protein